MKIGIGISRLQVGRRLGTGYGKGDHEFLGGTGNRKDA